MCSNSTGAQFYSTITQDDNHMWSKGKKDKIKHDHTPAINCVLSTNIGRS